MKTLYKLGNSGKVETWSVLVEDFDNHSEIVVQYGKQGGAMQEKRTIVEQGKNLGKSNSTNAKQQARLEMESKIAKQRDKCYQDTIPTTKTIVRPMLAQSFKDHADKLILPCYIQRKYDGIRCLGYSNKLESRKGKAITSIPHIFSLLNKLPSNIILDGELYSNRITFQEITSIVRKEDVNERSNEIEYHVYDMIDLANPQLSFNDRHFKLNDIIEEINSNHLIGVQTLKCDDRDDIDRHHKTFVSQGYEGSILRNADSPYEIDKRSYNLLKRKDFLDAEFEITGGSEDKNGEVVFTCKTKEGKEFGVKPKGTREVRRAYLDDLDSYIGQLLTVRYFEMTDDNIPRFPIGVEIRDFE